MKTRLAAAFGALAILIVGIATEAVAKKDRTTLISRQSASAGGQGGDDFSDDPMVSANGRWVVFESAADNLGGPIDTDVFNNIYVYDRKRKKVRLVSRRSKTAGGIGADGNSNDPSISGNGRFVAFESEATNLSAATNTDPAEDNVYVYDLKRKRIQLVSRRSRSAGGGGADDPSRTSTDGGGAISKSGRFVIFETDADNLGGPIDPLADDNVYVYDRKRKKVRLVSRRSRAAGGQGGDGSNDGAVISRNGRFAAFDTQSDNLGGPIDALNLESNVYVYDLKRKRIRLVSRRSRAAGGQGGDDFSENPSISSNGRFIAFETESDNLGGPIDPLANDNVYVYDLKRRRVVLVSRQSKPAGNAGGDDASDTASISGSGRFVVFESEATNLGGPTNTLIDQDNVYLRDRGR